MHIWYTAGAAAAPSTKSLRLKVTLLAGVIYIILYSANGRPAGSSSGVSVYTGAISKVLSRLQLQGPQSSRAVRKAFCASCSAICTVTE